MRLNRYVAIATGISRRKADEAISGGQVVVNGRVAVVGDAANTGDKVTLGGRELKPPKKLTIILNKPSGYVVSRNGQGNPTIYELLPEELHSLKPVGRLDKDSSGLLLLTNDGELANHLTHPSYAKEKVYEISLDKELAMEHKEKIEKGVVLEDGISRLTLAGNGRNWTIRMYEGRNRQIRRTFSSLGYAVKNLHRSRFGPYELKNVKPGAYIEK